MIPFGLNNSPMVFMDLINSVFEKYVDIFVIVLFDDILIYSQSEDEHVENLRILLQAL